MVGRGRNKEREINDLVFRGNTKPLDNPNDFIAVIPFYLKKESNFRKLDLLSVLKNFKKQKIKVILVCQDRLEDDIQEGRLLSILKLDFYDGNFHKSALINAGIEKAKENKKWKWLIQCDSDIVCNFSNLESYLKLNGARAAMPWSCWVRLSKDQTKVVREDLGAEMDLEGTLERRINRCSVAGGICLAREVLNDFKWDERYINWGWEDSDVASRLESGGIKIMKAPGCAVHLWHENDRILQIENGNILFKDNIPRKNIAGVLLESKTKFLLVAMGRSGGNLLSKSLNQHPNIYCNSAEPLIHENPPHYIRNNNIEIRDWALNGPLLTDKQITGMRTQYFIEKSNYGFTAMDLAKWAESQDFLIIHLVRKNISNMIISHFLAESNHSWIGKKYSNRKIKIDPEIFCKKYIWLKEQQISWAANLNQCLTIYYEDLCENWDDNINLILDYLGVSRTTIKKAIEKQSAGDHRSYVENWNEIESMLGTLNL